MFVFFIVLILRALMSPHLILSWQIDVASTSPSNSSGFIPSSLSSNSSMTDYEVEVVEIRVKEGELKDIIP